MAERFIGRVCSQCRRPFKAHIGWLEKPLNRWPTLCDDCADPAAAKRKKANPTSGWCTCPDCGFGIGEWAEGAARPLCVDCRAQGETAPERKAREASDNG